MESCPGNGGYYDEKSSEPRRSADRRPGRGWATSWTVGELVEAALAGVVPGPVGRQAGPFRVIDGGKP